MNRSHASLTRWGLSHVTVDPRYTILDVGCGGGRTIDTLAGMAKIGKVYGVDYSSASVAAARRTNAEWVWLGRAEIKQGTVSSLPFPAETFDLVTAVETHYYWPDLAADLREILRVLKPGGTVLLIAETYKGRNLDWIYRPAMKLLNATYLTLREHRDVLLAAGFTDVEVFEHRAKGWVCAKGRRLTGNSAEASLT
jgi:ubiquinone/menaquinone biosynthesis C-methylase UbiE